MVESEHFDPTLQASMQKRQRAATSQQSAIEHVKVEERERRTPATTSTISVPLNTAVLSFQFQLFCSTTHVKQFQL